ncbi:hypothetical protein [Halorubellus litoreus]|uniref:Uncharacterized protein n=1 Tax=Halorubellus litoreus TaxID=755308 RepID=A0ABD5VI83_9EURY
MIGLIPNASRVRNDLTALTKRAFQRFEADFGLIGDQPFPATYTSVARYLAARIAVPHWFVRTHVGSAESDQRVNRTPKETVADGGNCVDQCVLLGSIWATMSVPSELLSINSQERNASHLTAVATVPPTDNRPSSEALTDELVRLYDALPSRTVDPDDVHVWTDDGDLRVIADPVFCDYAGDVESMANQGFLTVEDQKPEWAYHNVIHDVLIPLEAPAHRRHEST